jgi:hypothetical protein
MSARYLANEKEISALVVDTLEVFGFVLCEVRDDDEDRRRGRGVMITLSKSLMWLGST